MCIAKLLMGPVRHQYHRKAVEPLEYVQTFLSTSFSVFSVFIGIFLLASSFLPVSLVSSLQLKQIILMKKI